MEDKFDILILDIFNIYYKNYYTKQEMSFTINGKTILTGGIYGSILYIRRLVDTYLKEDGRVVITSDNFASKVNLRRQINPNYKSNRDKKSTEFYRAIEYLLLILLNYSDTFSLIQKKGLEADDFVPYVIDTLDRSKSVLAVSADLDWARIIDYDDRDVKWYDGKQIVTHQIFLKKFGFLPSSSKLIMYKAIRGDMSDNIKPGIPNLPSKLLMQLIDYKDIYSLLDELPLIEFLSTKWKAKILEQKSHLILNFQMVSYIELSESIESYTQQCSYRPKHLQTLYKGLGFSDAFDKRLQGSLLKKKATKIVEDSFFEQSRIPRV